MVLRGCAVFALVAVGCSGCPQNSSVDGSAVDSSGDAAGDSMVDTSRPEVLADSGESPDATGGYGPFVGDWGAFPGPPGCSDLLAKDPGTSVGPLKWEPCPSGRAGCERLVVDWGFGKRRLEVGYPEPVVVGGDGPLIPFLRIYNDPARPSIAKYGITAAQPIPKSGALPLLAVGQDTTSGKSPPACGLALDFGPWGFVASKSYVEEKQVFAYSRTWDGSIEHKRLYSYGSLISQPVGDTVFAAVTSAAMRLETDLPRGLAIIDLATGDVNSAKSPPRAVETPRAVSGGTITRMIGPPWGLYFASDTGASAQILATATGRAVLQHVVDHARADAILWVEGTPDFKDTILWDSPLARTMTELKPRKVARMPEGWWGKVVANAGVVLFSVDGSTARLLRISDGLGWTIRSEPDLVFKSAVWADDNEVWFTTAAAADAAEGPSGMIKLKRSALGSADLPSGL